MTIQLSMFESSGDLQHPELDGRGSGDLQHPELTDVSFENLQITEQQKKAMLRFLNKGKPKDGSGSIQIYNKKNKSYYHYSYWNGWKTAHKHICGGRVGNPKVESRVQIIKQMIDREAPVSEILNMISAFK